MNIVTRWWWWSSSSCRTVCMDFPDSLSLFICSYRPLLLASLPKYILCPYRAVVDKFLLAIPVKCCIGERHLWVCPAGLVHFIWMALEMGDQWPYSCCFMKCCYQDLYNIARRILAQFLSSFCSICLVSFHVVYLYSSIDTTTAWKLTTMYRK